MTDKAFEEVLAFVRRAAVPPVLPILSKGIGVPIFVDDEVHGPIIYEFGKPMIYAGNPRETKATSVAGGNPCEITRLVVTHEDYQDLSRRVREMELAAAPGVYR